MWKNGKLYKKHCATPHTYAHKQIIFSHCSLQLLLFQAKGKCLNNLFYFFISFVRNFFNHHNVHITSVHDYGFLYNANCDKQIIWLDLHVCQNLRQFSRSLYCYNIYGGTNFGLILKRSDKFNLIEFIQIIRLIRISSLFAWSKLTENHQKNNNVWTTTCVHQNVKLLAKNKLICLSGSMFDKNEWHKFVSGRICWVNVTREVAIVPTGELITTTIEFLLDISLARN